MKIVGLTGGIGSGKTTIAKAFEDLGVPLFIADEYAKGALENDQNVKQQVISLLGAASYSKINGVDKPARSFIASKVFESKDLLEKLNAIIHPAVYEQFKDWKKNQTSAYGIYEAAILFETGGDSRCDDVLLITAPLEMRIQRVIDRDTVSRDQVLSRINNQWPQKLKLYRSNMVINNININEISHNVNSIHEFLLKQYN